MSLADFLWACPRCGTDRGLRRGPDPDTCAACGTRFRRGANATIQAVAPDGTVIRRTPAEWAEQLPDIDSLLRDETDRAVRTASCGIRAVTGERHVHGETGYLNRVEVFGDEVPGRIELFRDRIVVEAEGQGREAWALEELTAVQTSSRALQLKRRGHPLVSFEFSDDSSYLWERLVRAALRDLYGRTGRGEIVEFQPRITLR